MMVVWMKYIKKTSGKITNYFRENYGEKILDLKRVLLLYAANYFNICVLEPRSLVKPIINSQYFWFFIDDHLVVLLLKLR